ncbi:MAG: hypothetical protein V3W34_03385 [Phycisphaerae bacterium]
MIERTYQERGDTWHVREHDLQEFISASVSEPPHAKNQNHHGAHEFATGEDFRPDWRGGTYDEAQTRRVWPEGLAKLSSINLDGAKLPTVKARRRVRRWGEDGDEFSRDRFDSGYLDCWETRKRETTDAPASGVIRLTVERSANRTSAADSLIWSGVAAAKLVDELESAGYRVELDVLVSIAKLNGRDYFSVDVIHVKRADEPLNMAAVLFAIAHPLFFRYHIFAALLRRPIKCNSSLGHATTTPAGLRGDIHIARVHTRDDAVSAVRDELRKRS